MAPVPSSRLMKTILVLTVVLAALTTFVRWLEPRLAFFPSPGEQETPRDAGLAYQPITLETRDGERLHGWVMPAAAAKGRILYFHGNGGNLSNWLPIVSAIVRHGYSLVVVDYRGYGLSSGRPTERGLYRDVAAMIQYEWSDSDRRLPLIYWGRSLGGAMAAYAASERPPDGVIIEAGFPDARAAVRGSPALSLLSHLASYRFAAAGFLNTARAPVLQLHGDRDRVIPLPLGRELFEQLAVTKEFVTIAGGDHNDSSPADAAAYWAAIDRFVSRRPVARDDSGR